MYLRLKKASKLVIFASFFGRLVLNTPLSVSLQIAPPSRVLHPLHGRFIWPDVPHKSVTLSVPHLHKKIVIKSGGTRAGIPIIFGALPNEKLYNYCPINMGENMYPAVLSIRTPRVMSRFIAIIYYFNSTVYWHVPVGACIY